jgi:hypothetical protein
MSGSAIEFKLDALETIQGPGVYMYCVGDEALYIGSSRKVIGRALARNHHRLSEPAKALGITDQAFIHTYLQ